MPVVLCTNCQKNFVKITKKSVDGNYYCPRSACQRIYQRNWQRRRAAIEGTPRKVDLEVLEGLEDFGTPQPPQEGVKNFIFQGRPVTKFEYSALTDPEVMKGRETTPPYRGIAVKLFGTEI